MVIAQLVGMTTTLRLSPARRLLIGCACTIAALSQNATVAHAQVVIGSQRTVPTPVEWQQRPLARVDSTTLPEAPAHARSADAAKPSFSVTMRGFFRRRGPRGARMGGGGMGQVGAILRAPLFGVGDVAALRRRW